MPAFPQPYTSTVSHWQATNRGPTALWNHGRDAPLPSSADYVIIGAGATGTALAYHLSRHGGAGVGKRIVILDAKDVASGASGRNGGHVAPYGWQSFNAFLAPLREGGAGLTAEQALDILFFEQDNLDLVERILREEGIDADFWRGERFEVITTPESAAQNLANYRLLQRLIAASPKHRGRVLNWSIITDPAEAKRVSRLKNAIHVNRISGGSWHPHRGVTAILRACLQSKISDVQFFSWAPVTGINSNPDGSVGVDCGARGTITAQNVIVATNGYTRHLLPELENVLVPLRANAGLVTPPAAFAGPNSLPNPYTIIDDGPYLIVTPHAGLVLGPYVGALLGSGECTLKEIYGIDDDSEVQPGAQKWLESYCRDHYTGWEEGAGEGLAKAWSGVICHTADLMPLVGRMPGRPGVWIAAGYNGHGMGMIHMITRGLAHTLKTGKWDDAVPRVYEVSAERLERVKNAPHPLEYPPMGIVYRYNDRAKI